LVSTSIATIWPLQIRRKPFFVKKNGLSMKSLFVAFQFCGMVMACLIEANSQLIRSFE
jgi:hypothetical protein